MKRELTWKQAYDWKVAENAQLRRDGNTIIDRFVNENQRLRAFLRGIQESTDLDDAHNMARRALESK